MKKIAIITVAFLLTSCTILRVYPQDEFLIKYDKLVMKFNKVLEEPITKKQLKKMEKNFIFFKKQLEKRNEDYARIDKNIVEKHKAEINHYLGIIEDLRD